MFAVIMTAVLSPFGGLVMSEEPKEPWTEKVTVRVWDNRGKKFQDPVSALGAYRETRAGADLICVEKLVAAKRGEPDPGSEIIDGSGNVYIVLSHEGGRSGYVYSAFACRVKPKPVAAAHERAATKP